MQTLVIGDLHGHHNRLEALLRQEELLEDCPRCVDEHTYCDYCDDEGIVRTKRDEVEVVLVGDIGHFGRGGSPTGDTFTLRAAKLWADVVLWGNHDRAVVAPQHHFSGYERPTAVALRYLRALDMKLAHAAHGYLITHAGLHVSFKNQRVAPEAKTDPAVFADWINAVSDEDAEGTAAQFAVRDAVGRYRGGGAPAGGILWRDIGEKLFDGYPQVFGHSASREHIVRYAHRNWYTGKPFGQLPPEGSAYSYCVDIGGKGDIAEDECLAGIYLPTEKIVRVDL